jgi:hypothetical protein
MAEEFVKLVKGEFEEVIVTKDGVLMVEGKPATYKRKPTGAEWAVIRAFLKDNNITGVPEDNTALGRLKEALAAKQAGKPAVALPTDPRLDLPEPEYPMQ